MNYCYKCGSRLILKECFNCGVSEGEVPYCEKCGEFRFPIFNVAASMIIYNKDFSKILLIKQYGRDFNVLVAGYVNKGEYLEETVRREVMEEVGLNVIDCKYNASRYFEKSNTLICNFIVQVSNENFTLNGEVDSAEWYSIKDAETAIKQNSLAEYFLKISTAKIPAIK